jgi:hypothetical protein
MEMMTTCVICKKKTLNAVYHPEPDVQGWVCEDCHHDGFEEPL